MTLIFITLNTHVNLDLVGMAIQYQMLDMNKKAEEVQSPFGRVQLKQQSAWSFWCSV